MLCDVIRLVCDVIMRLLCVVGWRSMPLQGNEKSDELLPWLPLYAESALSLRCEYKNMPSQHFHFAVNIKICRVSTFT